MKISRRGFLGMLALAPAAMQAVAKEAVAEVVAPLIPKPAVGGITLEKLRRAQAILNDAQTQEPKYLLVNPQQWQELQEAAWKLHDVDQVIHPEMQEINFHDGTTVIKDPKRLMTSTRIHGNTRHMELEDEDITYNMFIKTDTFSVNRHLPPMKNFTERVQFTKYDDDLATIGVGIDGAD